MKCVGIIAEYNPFHNGHEYHIKKARELTGADYVIVVMSGSFVQRGDVAVCDKLMRTRHALMGGADLVIELPTPFSLSNAEIFAQGAIALLASTGIVDTVCFGSVCGDVELLTNAARSILNESPNVKEALIDYLGSGMSYPRALAKAFEPETSKLFSDANDILGIEYIKAILSTSAKLTPVALTRLGPAHDSNDENSGFTSASALRSAMLNGDTAVLRRCMPEYAAEDVIAGMHSGRIPRENRNLTQALLYKLRSIGAAGIATVPDISEGLENVISRAAYVSGDYGSLLASIKTRRYTMARIKRALMCALLDIKKEHTSLDSLYIRVLGVRRDALILLSRLSQGARVPVITRFSERDQLSEAALKICDIDMLASWLSGMATPVQLAPKYDYTSPLIMV